MSDIIGITFILLCAGFALWIVQRPAKAKNQEPPPLPFVPKELPPRLMLVRRNGIVRGATYGPLTIRQMLLKGELNGSDEVQEVGFDEWLPIDHTDLALPPPEEYIRDQVRAMGRSSMSPQGAALIAQADAMSKAGGWMYLVNPIAAFGIRRAAKSLRQAGEEMRG